jgi:hypothetical protein
MKTHRFNGQRYDIHIGEIDGMCDSPMQGLPNLVIALEKENTMKFLETCIHEGLHACNYSTKEELVTQSAHDIARLLWRLGYRLKSPGV